jgi:hypothetical protein
MLRACLRVLALPLVLGLALSAAAPVRAEKPMAVVSVKSFDAVMSDVKYLVTLAGHGDRAQELDGLINALTGGQGIGGLDTKRPFGVIVPLTKQLEGDPPAIFFLPVTKDEEFLNFLTQVNFPAQKDQAGLYSLNAPTGSVYLRFAHKHVFASNKQDLVKGDLPDPAAALTGVHKDNLIAASIRLAQIPNEFKQEIIRQVDEGIERERQKSANKPDIERKAQEAGVKIAREALVGLIEGSDEVTMSMNVDQKQARLSADLTLKAKPGSGLVKRLQSFGAGRSMFAGLARDTAAHLLVRLPVPEEIRKPLRDVLDAGFKEAMQKETDARKKALAERVFKTLEPTLTADVIDLGGVIRGPLADQKYVLAGAAQVKDGKKIEQLLRDLLKEVPARERERIKLDHAKHGDVAIHMVQVPDQDVEENFRKNFGQANLFVALRDDALLLSAGDHGLEAIKEAIDQAGKGATGTAAASAPIVLDLSVARLAPLSPENREQVVAAAQKVFTGADKDKDRIRVTVQGGDGLNVRLEMSALMVKLWAVARNVE